MTVEEIKTAILDLSPDEVRRIADWLLERDQELWDQQMDRDSASGKLDFLFEEADKQTSDSAQ